MGEVVQFRPRAVAKQQETAAALFMPAIVGTALMMAACWAFWYGMVK